MGECAVSDKMAGFCVGIFFLGGVLFGIPMFGAGRMYMADRIKKIIHTTEDLELVIKELGKVPE
jgi:hypothetical protein